MKSKKRIGFIKALIGWHTLSLRRACVLGVPRGACPPVLARTGGQAPRGTRRTPFEDSGRATPAGEFDKAKLLPVWLTALIIACAVSGGCGTGPVLSASDRDAIGALEQYRPKYRLDNDGRVLDLQLDGR